MKIPRSSAFRTGLALALASVSTAIALADGELDLGFSPPPELGTNFVSGFAVVGGRAYLGSPSFSVLRLRDDGSPDPGWQLSAPTFGLCTVAGLPSGGLAVLSNSGLLFKYDDGSFLQSGPLGISPFFARAPLVQDDGSVALFDQQFARKAKADGSADPNFRIKVSLPAVDTSNSSGSGSLSLTAAGDRQGRYVVIGNFHATVPADRLGLLRLRADGSLDPDWNPSPELGLKLNGGGVLNSQPVAVETLPDDSAVVVLKDQLAWIDVQGKVTRRTANLSNYPLNLWHTVTQPDGKTIVGGNFTQWGDSPASGLIRLNADGTLDPTFAVQLDGPPLVNALCLDSQGRLWISGEFRAVNGVARPGIARLQAYTPVSADPVALRTVISVTSRHVATNETLFLTAKVDGHPEPAMQWLRDGVPVAGATNRGLRLSITNGSELGAFSLVLSNDFGSQKLDFPATTLAVRSPQPGLEDLAFSRSLTNFSYVTHLLPLPDGRLLVANGDPYQDQSAEAPLVGRLLPNGVLDASFGQGGVVQGRGRVETLIPLPEGGMLVTGQFTELGGRTAQGLAELDRDGKVVLRAWPKLDIAHVSTALPLPDGKLIIAGRFETVGGAPAFRLARLNSDLTLDPTFHYPLTYWEFVDALALDARGRVLIAGERMYFTGSLTNPPRAGLNRLLADGSPDPAFHARTNGIHSIFLEPDGNLLVGMPPLRLDEDGNVLTVFDDYQFQSLTSFLEFQLSDGPNHLMVRTASGGVVYRTYLSSLEKTDLALPRWKASGERDYGFQAVVRREGGAYPSVTAIAALPDDSLLFSVRISDTLEGPTPLEQARRLRRIRRDSDFSLRIKDVSAGQFQVALETQPGLSYEVYRRDQLTGGTATKIGEYSGDGYVIDLQTPATGDATYLELRRH